MKNLDFKYVEVTIKFVGDNYQETREMYSQRINYEWAFLNRPMLIQQIVAVVNELELPDFVYRSPTPGAFTKEEDAAQ
jgi:hypothetical protein